MKTGRTALSLVLAVSLAACGGGDGSPAPAPAPIAGGPTPTPSSTPSACSIASQNNFANNVLNEWYLFPDLLATANPASFGSVQSFLDARVAPARAAGRDQGFTFATSISEESALISSGSSAGFGIRLSYDTAARRLFVTEAFEGANGLAAGLDRGSEIIAIGTTSTNLQSVTSLFASGGSQAVADALGPSTAGTSRVLRFIQPGGAVIERTVVKTDFALDPISDRYGAVIINDGARRIGYINLRTFIISDAATQLRQAYGQLAAQGVTELILDFRYNGGGLVSVADTMGDLMGSGRVGQVWSRTVLRPSKSAENSTRLFRGEANAIAPTKIAVISTSATASASELVTNSLIPYLNSNLALVGSNTSGKPVGQFAFDLSECDLRVRAVAFQTVNASGRGEYFNGLASEVPNTCRAGDDFTRPLGDPREASIAAALDFLAGRACTPIAKSGPGNQAISMSPMQRERVGLDIPERTTLMPDEPSAAQYEIPGLF
jgi:C-terminal processing protease CtpA/Prc